MKHVFLDSDVLLDYLADRQPFGKVAEKLLALASAGSIWAYTSPLIIANVHYLLRRFSDEKTAGKALSDLLQYVPILLMNEEAVRAALRSPFSDFEDTLQHEAALQSGQVEVILTRNLKDYKSAVIPVLSPDAFLAALLP